MQEYKEKLKHEKVTSLSTQISMEWKALPEAEHNKWKKAAEQDKLRYDAEKSLYKGPWRVSSERPRKDPDAPKRPPSAFLNYCRTRRSKLIKENPDLKNTDISKLLGKEWQKAPTEVRRPHVEREQRERVAYLERMSEWRKQRHRKEDLIRQQRIAAAEHCVLSNTAPRAPLMPPSDEISKVPPRGESLMVMPSFSQRCNIPAPVLESWSLNNAYNNPSVPSITVPWHNNVTAGYFHMFTSASSAQVPNDAPATWATGLSVNALVPLLPKPLQVPQAPFEVAKPLQHTELVDEIPTLPFALSTDCPQACLTASSSEMASATTLSSESSHVMFPSIFYGDTRYDPPLLDSPGDSTVTSESLSDGE